MGPLRVVVVVFVLLAIIYLWLARRQHRRERRRLNKEFDAGGIEGTRDEYVARGMEAFDHSLRHRLILGVFILPLIAIGVIVYVMNFM
ncbi:MAG: hypothetical protein ACE5DK_05205 [Paracoccaceae bacterium]